MFQVKANTKKSLSQFLVLQDKPRVYLVSCQVMIAYPHSANYYSARYSGALRHRTCIIYLKNNMVTVIELAISRQYFEIRLSDSSL